MIEVLSRLEFIDHAIGRMNPGKMIDSSVIFMPETAYNREICCEHFICVPPIKNIMGFWEWAKEGLQGEARCFSSDDFGRKEWWGFTNKDDILIFVLRWS